MAKKKKKTTKLAKRNTSLPIPIDKQKELMVELLALNNVNISQACKKVGISRQTYYEWRKEDKEFDTAIIEREQAFVDDLEQELVKHAVSYRKTRALEVLLKAKATDRGYGDDPVIHQTKIDKIEIIQIDSPEDFRRFNIDKDNQ